MKRVFGHIYAILIFIIAGCVLLVSNGCSALGGEGFAIYLTKGDIPPSQMEALSHVDIADYPVIAMNDIISYNATTHEITLTADAYDRISTLEVPVRGRSFMVCVDRKLIYWGAFWTPVSSQSFSGVTIWKPMTPQTPRVISLQLGYPSPDFYGGEDPRNNVDVMKSLEQAGKLTKQVDKPPHSLKGYELYSWSTDDLWHFTLITGTNRNKTLKEITSIEDTVSKDGWVTIHVVGVDAVKTVLSKIPQNEFVIWLASMREQTGQTDSIIRLPPGQIIDAVKEHARQCGLDFAIVTP